MPFNVSMDKVVDKDLTYATKKDWILLKWKIKKDPLTNQIINVDFIDDIGRVIVDIGYLADRDAGVELKMPGVDYVVDIKTPDNVITIRDKSDYSEIDYSLLSGFIDDDILKIWAKDCFLWDTQYLSDDEYNPWDSLSDYWSEYEYKESVELIWNNYLEQAIETYNLLEQLKDSRSIAKIPFGIELRWKKLKWQGIRSGKAIGTIMLTYTNKVNIKIPKGSRFWGLDKLGNKRYFVTTEEFDINEKLLEKNSTYEGHYELIINVEAEQPGDEYNDININNSVEDFFQDSVTSDKLPHKGTNQSPPPIREYKFLSNFTLFNKEQILIEVPYLLDQNYNVLDIRDDTDEPIDYYVHVIVPQNEAIIMNTKTNTPIKPKYLSKYTSGGDVIEFWAPKYKVHNSLIIDTMAEIVELNKTIFGINKYSELYLSVIKALWYVLVQGPTMENIKIALCILLNLPMTLEEKTVIKEISYDRDSVVTENGFEWHFNKGFNVVHPDTGSLLKEGDVIVGKYKPLVDEVGIMDYIDNPRWWDDAGFFIDEVDVEKYNTAYIGFTDQAFFNETIDLRTIDMFLRKILSSHVNLGLNVTIESANPATTGLFDRLFDGFPEKVEEYQEGQPLPEPEDGYTVLKDDKGKLQVVSSLGSEDKQLTLFHSVFFMDGWLKYNNIKHNHVEFIKMYGDYETQNITADSYNWYMDNLFDEDFVYLEDKANLWFEIIKDFIEEGADVNKYIPKQEMKQLIDFAGADDGDLGVLLDTDVTYDQLTDLFSQLGIAQYDNERGLFEYLVFLVAINAGSPIKNENQPVDNLSPRVACYGDNECFFDNSGDELEIVLTDLDGNKIKIPDWQIF